MDLKTEIKESFKSGSALTKIIYVNIGIFLLAKLAGVIFFLFGSNVPMELFVRNWLGVPSNIGNLLIKPWTIITYSFTHTGFLHLFFNLLWLYFFGKLFIQYFGNKKFFGLYVLGSLFGALFYVGIYNISPAFSQSVFMSTCIGASASAMAIAAAISVYEPNYKFNLLFIGPVKIIYILAVFVLLDIISIADSNSGGHIAHLGGALAGYLFAKKAEAGKDFTKGINKFIDNLVTFFKGGTKSNMKVTYKKETKKMTDLEYNAVKRQNQKEIDRILDKIAKKGYNSLSEKEKEILFKAGK